MLLVIFVVPKSVYTQTREGDTTGDTTGATPTVVVVTPPVEVDENFVDLEIEPQLRTPSAWSIFWTKEMQNLSLLATINSVDDATKRVKYSEESMQLAKLIISESIDASHSDKTVDLIKRSEDLIMDLNDRKEDFLLKNNELSKKLAQNIMVHIKHRNDIMIIIEDKIDRNALVDGGVKGTVFLRALDTLKTATVRYRQEITEAARENTNKTRGTGIFKNDQDRDGVPDDVEKEMGLSIIDPDTDGDGLADKKEIEVYGTDPTKVDTDGDGYWDGMEIISGYSPLGLGKMDDKAIKQRGTNSEKFLNRMKTERQTELTEKSLNYFTKVKDNFIFLNLDPQPPAPTP